MKERQRNDVTKESIRQMIVDGTFCDWYSENIDLLPSNDNLQWLKLFLDIVHGILNELVSDQFIFDYELWPPSPLELLNCASIRKVQ